MVPPTNVIRQGWRVLESSEGRYWATRERPFSLAAEKAGAFRTVDANTRDELAGLIATQENIAAKVDAAASVALEELGVVITREERRLAVLRDTHPGWRIVYLPEITASWWAVRAKLTPAQRDAGVVPSLARRSGEELAAALALQDEIVHSIP
ncbi:hypothetical protein [Microtetraspora malaysiensis]|uniref:hypothetical protein n=1 Tax=Microtetraspora malaysiensis TaxID=161358 RepID=UPI003D91A124